MSALRAEDSAKSRRIAQQFCATPAGTIGPIQARLHTYDPVRGLVFGTWGEGSPNTERLLAMFARAGATRHWVENRFKSPLEAGGAIAWLLRRR